MGKRTFTSIPARRLLGRGDSYETIGNVTDIAIDDTLLFTADTLGVQESSLTIEQSQVTGLVDDLAVLSSSGVLTGGVISIGTGGAGVATTFTITSGTGVIVDNTVSPSTVTPITWTAKTDVAVTNILTSLITFVAIDSGGNVIQSTTDFTPEQMRQYVVIGVVVHANQTTVNAVNQAQIVAYNQGNQLSDLLYGLGIFNLTGNVFSPNGANLKIDKSAGSIFRRGANYASLSNNPHVKTTASLTQASLRMQNQTGAGSASTTDVDVANYDVGGVTTAIAPATRFSILRVFLFQSNLVAVQRGQAIYNSLAEAKAAIQTENFITNSVLLQNGLLRGFIIAQANATSLSDTSKVFFIAAGKFGGASGVGGLSVSTMQNAYDNSSTPEILTDSTRGALSVRRGSAADTDNILEGLNGSGSTTFSVDGNGDVTCNKINHPTFAAGGTVAGAASAYLTGGSLLSSQAAGAIEFVSSIAYLTPNTTDGRSVIPVLNEFRLFSSGSAITTIANFFGANSNIPLEANANYEIEVYMLWLKGTNGTGTYTFTHSAAPTACNYVVNSSPAGAGATGASAPSTGNLDGVTGNSTATSFTYTTASVNSGSAAQATWKIFLKNGSGTNLKIQMTASAGNITPLIGSYWRARRIPTTNNGTYAA